MIRKYALCLTAVLLLAAAGCERGRDGQATAADDVSYRYAPDAAADPAVPADVAERPPQAAQPPAAPEAAAGGVVAVTPARPATGWAYVSAGVAHTAAVRADGTLWAWGTNIDGQLGTGASGWDAGSDFPVRVGAAANWATVSVGATHTVGVRTDGTLWAFGSNSHGQLGDGTTTGRNSPVRIGTRTDWAAVSAGWGYTLAICRGGTLWAWGQNTAGVTGLGTAAGNTFVPTQVGTQTNWAAVSASWGHSAAVRTDGTLWAWGSNGSGQLGDGSTVDRLVPVRVGTASNWASVSASRGSGHPYANGGGYFSGPHTVAVTRDGQLWAWGANSWGQLGDGTGGAGSFRNTPVRIGTASNWASVSTGHADTAAVRTDGTLWFWSGDSSNVYLDWNRELQTVANPVWQTPAREGTASNWVSSSGGGSYAINANGSLWNWHWEWDEGGSGWSPAQVEVLLP